MRIAWFRMPVKPRPALELDDNAVAFVRGVRLQGGFASDSAAVLHIEKLMVALIPPSQWDRLITQFKPNARTGAEYLRAEGLAILAASGTTVTWQQEG